MCDGVIIDESHDISAALLQCRIARRAQTLPWFAMAANAGKLVYHVLRGVGFWGIIDDEDFEWAMCTIHERCKAARQVLRPLACAYRHGQGRLRAIGPRKSR